MTQVTACPRSTELKVKNFLSPLRLTEDQKMTPLLCKVSLNSGRRSRIAGEGEIAFITKRPEQTHQHDHGPNMG